jgi:hypothetical protein
MSIVAQLKTQVFWDVRALLILSDREDEGNTIIRNVRKHTEMQRNVPELNLQ